MKAIKSRWQCFVFYFLTQNNGGSLSVVLKHCDHVGNGVYLSLRFIFDKKKLFVNPLGFSVIIKISLCMNEQGLPMLGL